MTIRNVAMLQDAKHIGQNGHASQEKSPTKTRVKWCNVAKCSKTLAPLMITLSVDEVLSIFLQQMYLHFFGY